VSVLLIGGGALTSAVIERLVGAGDEVRVIEPDPARGEGLRALGAFVALGSPDDFDLVERAAQNVRTIVVLVDLDLEPVVRGASAARVDRVVVVGGSSATPGPLEEAAIDYVVLRVPPPRLLRGPRVSEEAVAEAIDAADDMAGDPRLVVDLGTAEGWRSLGLAPPEP
jgi:hypothetical protein